MGHKPYAYCHDCEEELSPQGTISSAIEARAIHRRIVKKWKGVSHNVEVKE